MQSEVDRFQEEAKKAQLQRLRDELEDDDKQIKFLMKKLGYNKRKANTMPEIFEKEGLHCELILLLKFNNHFCYFSVMGHL
jgi:hypothetical protein